MGGGPTYTVFKDVLGCSVENEPEGTEGEVGKQPGEGWGPGEARKQLAVLPGQREWKDSPGRGEVQAHLRGSPGPAG